MRQYIGARYVPDFSNNLWDITQEYEALVVVDNGYGTSYISRLPVPAGTPLTDTNYWIIYGADSPAIAHLQTEIDAIKEKFNTPEYYGAVGDGTTDDTDALQEAVNDSFILYIPEFNVYKISSITVPKGHSIIGKGTIKLSDDAANGIVLSGSNVIEGITVTDALLSYDDTYAAIYGDSVDDCVIKNVNFSDLRLAYAIRFDKSARCDISYNSIIDYSYAGIMLINGCHNMTIEHNYVYNGRNPQNGNSYPISISGYFNEYDDCARNIKCNFNHIKENIPVWEGIDSHGVVNAEIAFNIIEGTSRGIVLGGGPTSGSSDSIPENNKNISIHHNNITFDNDISYGQGIIIVENLKAHNHVMQNVSITDNIIKSENTPTSLSVLTSMIGVSLVSASASNITIENNIIDGENRGIGVEGYTSGSISNILIKNNDITGGVASNYFGIALDNIAIPFNSVVIEDNYIHDTTGYDIRGMSSNSGTDMIICKNNNDQGNYSNISFLTVPHSTFNTSTAAGKCGDFVPSAASDTSQGWFCKSAGTWIAL